MIELRDVVVEFEDKRILDGVNWTVEAQDRFSIIGESGCGKSTLLKLILGLVHPTSGDILYKGKSLLNMTKLERQQMRMEIGMLFQSAALFDSMTVGENVSFSLRENLDLSCEACEDRVQELLEMVDMTGTQDQMPSSLSGGQKKRIGLARTIAVEPSVMLYDEPTTGLDPVLTTSIENLIVKLGKEMGITTIVVSHQKSTFLRTVDKIYMMTKGKLIEALHEKLIYWELQLEKSEDQGMHEILAMQRKEANQLFSKYIKNNYIDWIAGDEDAPVMSHTLFNKKIKQELTGETTFLLVIDNLRLDQWKVLRPIFEQYYKVAKEDTYFSILPTATQYARNALFAGLLPSQIEKKFPQYWIHEDEEGSKNKYEAELLETQLKRLGLSAKTSYNKITNLAGGKKLAENFSNLLNNNLNTIVYNFVDMLSHARTEMEVIRELADDEAAYRSITYSWFEHSPLHDIVKKIAESGSKLIITTDHGTVKVNEPSKVVGDRNTNTNLRYKLGKNLSYNSKEVFEVRNPDDIHLPKRNVSTAYIFAQEDMFFAYPNNYNYYVNFYKNTFQHGGISMEEVIIPFIVLDAK